MRADLKKNLKWGVTMRSQSIKIMTVMMFIGITIFAGSCSNKSNPDALKIAQTYGFDQFNQVEAIMFTYNLSNDSTSIARHWIWNVKDNEIHYEGNDADGNMIDYSYVQGEKGEARPELEAQINSWFINDQYWLLYPYHLVWDKSAQITPVGTANLPIPPGKANELVVFYPEESSPMSGDTIKLFYDSSYQILQWVFYQAGPESSRLATTWDANSAVGPLMLSFERYNADSTFHVLYTGVAVKLQDVDGWIQPE